MQVRLLPGAPVKKLGGNTMARTWTKENALQYLTKAKQKGLTYWSAYDYLQKQSPKDLESLKKKEQAKKTRKYRKSNRALPRLR